MERRNLFGALVVLPLLAGGVVFSTDQAVNNQRQNDQVSEEGYVCPATGERLPCPNCCPLKKDN